MLGDGDDGRLRGEGAEVLYKWTKDRRYAMIDEVEDNRFHGSVVLLVEAD